MGCVALICIYLHLKLELSRLSPRMLARLPLCPSLSRIINCLQKLMSPGFVTQLVTLPLTVCLTFSLPHFQFASLCNSFASLCNTPPHSLHHVVTLPLQFVSCCDTPITGSSLFVTHPLSNEPIECWHTHAFVTHP